MTGLRDYVAWHDAYDDPDSSLSWRLGVVRSMLRDALDERSGEVRILSSCAGDGRDVLGVLAEREDAGRVRLTLLEVEPELVARARSAAAEVHATVEVREVDAGSTDAYVGAAPADVVLLVGILGNLSAADVESTVRAAPALCCEGGALIWTLSQQGDVGTDRVRDLLAEIGFLEERFESLDRGARPSVGLARLRGHALGLRSGERLFEFVR